ncbi:uncharacterized protein LOC134190774 [Corticium candelabrum]|uniref:uncharacterized protein LOC134190774 n=1 Tax=Corticium candelabrum TaxID=121492 RepID=UPI002E2523F4|nr:uncharacterized protein LOC134190774 [Corticium candelabrum]
MTAWLVEHSGKVFQGTCGWSDPTILQCGRFYPAWVKTAEDRLRHYSTVFPCVECDSSNYAIPSRQRVERWLSCVPQGFIFHFKAFGFFTRKYCPTNNLPRVIRSDLSVSLQQQSSVKWDEMPVVVREKLWELFNAALKPMHNANKLGIVVFQFHLGFGPVVENKQHVLECRRLLDQDYKMAVEFRNRKWIIESELSKTLGWLQEHDIGLICTDELEHELLNLTAPSKASDSTVVPIIYELGSLRFSYIRVHRRAGKERLLTTDQIERWSERLQAENIQRCIKGPIFFMWGTDHEDQPIINSKHLTAQLRELAFNWSLNCPKSFGNLLQFCSPLPKTPTAAIAEENEERTTLSERLVDMSPAKKSKQDKDTQHSTEKSATNISPLTKKKVEKDKDAHKQLKVTSFFSKQS